MEPTSLRFARAARHFGDASRRAGYAVPSFRSPPRLDNAHRSIRRSGSATTVSIQVRGRPWNAVLADMIEGVVVANQLEGAAAHQLREMLWSTQDDTELQVA